MKTRLDQALVARGLSSTRSQAESTIRLGKVEVDGKIVTKTGYFVSGSNKIKLNSSESYVSRAGLKLSGANSVFKVDFKDKIVLDVGSSTGGFTDYSLQRGAKKVVAVDVGTDQMHAKLAKNLLVELHEKTDIRDFKPKTTPDIILADVSFISLRQILPHLHDISSKNTQIIAMVKPQFETRKDQINRGVVKNERVRRQIMKNFENWVQKLFKIQTKADSSVPGEKGNLERFYLLKKLPKNPKVG